jgi:hypothetical protein
MDWFAWVADYRRTDAVEAEQIGQTPQGSDHPDAGSRHTEAGE